MAVRDEEAGCVEEGRRVMVEAERSWRSEMEAFIIASSSAGRKTQSSDWWWSSEAVEEGVVALLLAAAAWVSEVRIHESMNMLDNYCCWLVGESVR